MLKAQFLSKKIKTSSPFSTVKIIIIVENNLKRVKSFVLQKY